jgi:mannose-6-phosphate isomerase-like protein (cupin superfamily)
MSLDATGGVSVDAIETAEKPASEAKVIRYRTPPLKGDRGITPLCRTDIMYAAVQVMKEGTGNTLHFHTQLDGIFFVLRGRARFHGKDNVVHGDLGERDSILIPRGVSYWFESIGDEPLEMFQVEAITKGTKDKITFLEEKKPGSLGLEIFAEDGKLLENTLDKPKSRD